MTSLEYKIALCETIIQYVFTRKLLCLQALQTSGHQLMWQNNLKRVDTNSRLAVLGDAIAKAHLCEKWYATGQSKGQWTILEQTVLTNSNLGIVGREKGLVPCVILNDGTPIVSQQAMATTVEAILGAVYLDGGVKALTGVMKVLGLGRVT